MANNLEEGIFFADKVSKKIMASTEEEAFEKLNDFMAQNKNYKPKASTQKPQRDRSGRFFFEVTYNKKSAEDDKSLTGLAKKGLSKGKEIAKTVYNHLPVQDELKAEDKFKLGQAMAKFRAEHPDVKFGETKKNEDGTFSVPYQISKGSQNSPQTKDIRQQQTTSKNRISNIQKQLSKLSDDKLARIEKFINS